MVPLLFVTFESIVILPAKVASLEVLNAKALAPSILKVIVVFGSLVFGSASKARLPFSALIFAFLVVAFESINSISGTGDCIVS